MIKLLSKIFFIFFIVCAFTTAYSQPNTEDIELSQEQWEAVRDTFAIYAIKFLARLDTLQYQIDSLRKVNEFMETRDCEGELYVLVGATKEQVEDFRRKFTETEKKVNGKIGTPDDARAKYFNEITASKIRCLPEFADRYGAMKKKLDPWESTGIVTDAGSYNVVKGDCLWRIAGRKYTTPYLWPAIWDANKTIIVNPNLIYAGQVLKIPPVSDTQRKEAEEKSLEYRRQKRIKN